MLWQHAPILKDPEYPIMENGKEYWFDHVFQIADGLHLVDCRHLGQGDLASHRDLFDELRERVADLVG